jgi:hypothetical protein
MAHLPATVCGDAHFDSLQGVRKIQSAQEFSDLWREMFGEPPPIKAESDVLSRGNEHATISLRRNNSI